LKSKRKLAVAAPSSELREQVVKLLVKLVEKLVVKLALKLPPWLHPPQSFASR
jgi:hypothetical protein